MCILKRTDAEGIVSCYCYFFLYIYWRCRCCNCCCHDRRRQKLRSWPTCVIMPQTSAVRHWCDVVCVSLRGGYNNRDWGRGEGYQRRTCLHVGPPTRARSGITRGSHWCVCVRACVRACVWGGGWEEGGCSLECSDELNLHI